MNYSSLIALLNKNENVLTQKDVQDLYATTDRIIKARAKILRDLAIDIVACHDDHTWKLFMACAVASGLNIKTAVPTVGIFIRRTFEVSHGRVTCPFGSFDVESMRGFNHNAVELGSVLYGARTITKIDDHYFPSNDGFCRKTHEANATWQTLNTHQKREVLKHAMELVVKACK